jgi:hypothetical protein
VTVFLTSAEGDLGARTKLHGGTVVGGVLGESAAGVSAGEDSDAGVTAGSVDAVSVGRAGLAALSSQPGGTFSETPHASRVDGFGAGATTTGFGLAVGFLRC